MNNTARDVARKDSSRSRCGAVLTRRVVLPGLAAFLLAGCASVAKRAQPAGAKTSSSTKPAGQNASVAAKTSQSAAVAAGSVRKDSQPKTAQEFLAQQPVSLPFSNKD